MIMDDQVPGVKLELLDEVGQSEQLNYEIEPSIVLPVKNELIDDQDVDDLAFDPGEMLHQEHLDQDPNAEDSDQDKLEYLDSDESSNDSIGDDSYEENSESPEDTEGSIQNLPKNPPKHSSKTVFPHGRKNPKWSRAPEQVTAVELSNFWAKQPPSTAAAVGSTAEVIFPTRNPQVERITKIVYPDFPGPYEVITRPEAVPVPLPVLVPVPLPLPVLPVPRTSRKKSRKQKLEPKKNVQEEQPMLDLYFDESEQNITPKIREMVTLPYPAGVPGTSKTGLRPLELVSEPVLTRPSKRSRKQKLEVKEELLDEPPKEPSITDSDTDSESEVPFEPKDDFLYFDDPVDPLDISNRFTSEKIDHRECVRKTVDGMWQCLLCFRQTKRAHELIQHVNTHNYRCDKCGKCFAGRSGGQRLKHHRLTCMRIKPSHFCKWCGKAFKWKSQMKRHRKCCLKRNL
jgi:hypothetical protein